MTDDLVEFLRGEAGLAEGDDATRIARKLRQAADELERLQAIVELLPKQNGTPILPRHDPEDGTAEKLGILFRYSIECR